ncbi:uncharacterized protein LOC128387424 [Panonychus citri]|uniref:uncharacterized protein LOC128387424 n=1 Tax=Panonychus citri TaxID=50023 RepID=UPI002307BADA|nr:uncharacterized protein LOC128387424 [Panonychus citri]
MDKETAVRLVNWIQAPSNKFHADYKSHPGKGYFLFPIYIGGYSSLTQYIKFSKIEFTSSESDADIFTRFIIFRTILSSIDDCQLFASLESIITNTDYGLILSRVKTSLASIKLLLKTQPKDKPKTTLQICLNPNQSILEILETLLIPNLTLVNHFEFLVPYKNADVYAGLKLIVDAIKKSNLVSVTVALQDEPSPAPDFAPPSTTKTITYPPTLAIIFDDADIFSSVDRLLDMLSSLPVVHRKVDIWIQQSVRKKIAEKFEAKLTKSERLQVALQIDAINPILTPSDNPDEESIKLLTFRKIDELISIIKRYQMIRSTSLWTSNISSAFEITKEITNCHLFTVNTINDCPSPRTHTFLNHTNIEYKLLGEPSFQSRVPMASFSPHIDDVNLWKMPLKGNKNFVSLGIEDRFNVIASILWRNERITPQAIDLVRKAQLNHSSFETINKCLMLRQLEPIGIISVHFDKIEAIPDQSLIFGLIGSILLYGNSCLIVIVELPETIKQFFDEFNAIYPSSIFVASPSTPRPTIPYGWIDKDSEIIGLSFGLHHLTNLTNFDDCTSLFGRVRSLFVPVADQLSLSTSTPSGY